MSASSGLTQEKLLTDRVRQAKIDAAEAEKKKKRRRMMYTACMHLFDSPPQETSSCRTAFNTVLVKRKKNKDQDEQRELFFTGMKRMGS
jgi:hypothetical protein